MHPLSVAALMEAQTNQIPTCYVRRSFSRSPEVWKFTRIDPTGKRIPDHVTFVPIWSITPLDATVAECWEIKASYDNDGEEGQQTITIKSAANKAAARRAAIARLEKRGYTDINIMRTKHFESHAIISQLENAIAPTATSALINNKRNIADGRIMKLDMWLKRQSLTPKFNAALEASIAFKKRLEQWVQSPDVEAIAPTFHYQPQVC